MIYWIANYLNKPPIFPSICVFLLSLSSLIPINFHYIWKKKKVARIFFKTNDSLCSTQESKSYGFEPTFWIKWVFVFEWTIPLSIYLTLIHVQTLSPISDANTDSHSLFFLSSCLSTLRHVQAPPIASFTLFHTHAVFFLKPCLSFTFSYSRDFAKWSEHPVSFFRITITHPQPTVQLHHQFKKMDLPVNLKGINNGKHEFFSCTFDVKRANIC